MSIFRECISRIRHIGRRSQFDAARSFRRSAGFTITAVLSLALGIGANSAIFTSMDAGFWQPLLRPPKDCGGEAWCTS